MWNMICDVMPTISEDRSSCGPPGPSGGGGNCSGEENESSNIEQLMVTMLDDREKLMENIRETQEQLSQHQQKISDITKERDALARQLSQTMPQDYTVLSKELNIAREHMLEKDEEIAELKAERNNTRLLLEHLECLVARHERSLRMTVVKRQTQSSAGVSSEVEVLKALKSLFEHHKALDEKVRERLRAALERVSQLEEELARSAEQLSQLSSQGKNNGSQQGGPTIQSHEQDAGSKGQQQQQVTNAVQVGQNNNANGSNVQNDVQELEAQLERQTAELARGRGQIVELKARCRDIEEVLRDTQKDLLQMKEENQRLCRDLAENNAQKEDQEERITTLEKRCLNAQRESVSLNDVKEKLEHEVAAHQAQLRLAEERCRSLQERLQVAEEKLLSAAAREEKLIEEVAAATAAVEAAQAQTGQGEGSSGGQGKVQPVDKRLEERLTRLEAALEEKTQELSRARQREKMNEEHSQKLSSTVDKLLAESKERLEAQLRERMQALEEKNALAQELDQLRKASEGAALDKGKLLHEVDRMRQEMVHMQHFHEQQLANAHAMATEYANASLSNGLDHGGVGGGAGGHQVVGAKDGGSVVDSKWLMGDPAVDQSDAQALAMMLQEQLDAINNEILLIQEEKENTEQRAEELESRVADSWHRSQLISAAQAQQQASSAQQSVGAGGHPLDQQMQQMVNPRPPSSLGTPAAMGAGSAGGVPVGGVAYHGPPGEHRPLAQSRTMAQIIAERQLQQQQSNMLMQRELSGLHTPTEGMSTATSQESLSGKKKNKGIKSSFGRLFTKKDKKSSSMVGISQMYADSEYGSCSDIVGTHSGLASGLASPTASISSRDLAGFARGGGKDNQSTVDRRTKNKHDLLIESLKAGTPFALWNGPTIVAWLELWVGMPPWYVAACRANVKSGAIMSALSDTEIQREIGISNPLHRLKLRLAIQEMVALTAPAGQAGGPVHGVGPAKPLLMGIGVGNSGLAFGEMNHEWLGNEWLPSLGLAQYRSAFMECLVDARMLEHLTKKDLRVHLKMVDNLHRISLTCGFQCLKRLNFDRAQLEERRRLAEHETSRDVLVWSNERVMRWLGQIGLREFAGNLHLESGVHGALIALDEAFDANALAILLQIPSQNTAARETLEMEFNQLIAHGTERVVGSGQPGNPENRVSSHHSLNNLPSLQGDRLV
ncbi:liprin-alpha-2-like isoform X2 [Varroa jacobsoni]|uniref:SAM domain-containing protein n=1 Tax=Varroa destructor TaxID=109461 RepID=A0A7M7JUI0_VARDE|nr:liprin-alpha-2-like isoform X2 [Varroa destructor]XP_022688546.1 liprin-alpha-2-like isoform X2 [Varroa jacobsoni]